MHCTRTYPDSTHIQRYSREGSSDHRHFSNLLLNIQLFSAFSRISSAPSYHCTLHAESHTELLPENYATTFLTVRENINDVCMVGFVHCTCTRHVTFLQSVNIWQSYKQQRDCLVHFLRLLAVYWPDAE